MDGESDEYVDLPVINSRFQYASDRFRLMKRGDGGVDSQTLLGWSCCFYGRT